MKDRDRNELHLIIGQVASSYKRAGHDYAVARFLELLDQAGLKIVPAKDAIDPLATIKAGALCALFQLIAEMSQDMTFPYIADDADDLSHRGVLEILQQCGLVAETQGKFVLTHDALLLKREIDR
ncbi:MAG: hypothetical protein BGO05_16695 [Rhizobiales bacterium 63-7]|nr:hypothetical protein [Hyphomicrobiales bacterium]OJU69052.1 MAG: hypothetical protein BGO05_16695 [Rhizobiales bacterium 63-7]